MTAEDDLLDRLAMYKEKMEAIKAKIKSALFYPTAVMVVAFIVVAVIMLFVVPAFKSVFESFGADLPAPTLFVMGLSDLFVQMEAMRASAVEAAEQAARAEKRPPVFRGR